MKGNNKNNRRSFAALQDDRARGWVGGVEAFAMSSHRCLSQSMPIPGSRWKTRFPYLNEFDLALARIECSIHVVAAGSDLASIESDKMSRFRMRSDDKSVGEESS